MRAISSGEPWRGRVVVIRPDESRFPASISAAPVRLRKGRRILHAVLTMEDITDYELANHDLQERKKHEAMRTMVAGISHDFNNLLSGMVGNAYLLRKAVREDPKAMRRLATLEEALEEATAIIQGLVVYARGEEDGSGVLPLFPFVKEWCKEVRSQLPEGVELQLQLQPGHYPMRGDVALLKQVLTAVADNAVDALAGCERPRIAVSFGPEEESAVPEPLRGRGRVARLDVADSGCGIPGRLMERIWQPFFTTKPQGNGLGLTVARENMARLGGVMTVDSTEGEGTTVSLWLPLAG
ncbi:MAG: sensor histidine kinase [Zetaproteobacteria bacterium]|nr:MAG: sensor histidine kinase [Zetaproteobacteria bacterium]